MLPPSLNKSAQFVCHEQSLHGTKWKKSLNLLVVIRKTLNTVDASLSTFETTAHVQQKILHLCVESRPLAALDEIITTRSKVSGTVLSMF